jgi:aminoglycoside phosphotransferase (APT) family kinase protein
MNDLLDKPQQVRAEDVLDKHKLCVYLGKHLDGFNISDTLTIKQFSGGASNLTYLLQWGEGDQDKQQQAILRTAPRGANIKGAHDMGREFKVLELLENHFAYAPKALLYCDDREIIGRPFYLMQKVQGIIARKEFPMPVSAEQAHNLCKQLIDVQVALHEIDIKKTGLDALGHPQGYIQRQVSGWNKRYQNALVEGSDPATELMQWLSDNQPDDHDACLIHNDYKFDNVVLCAEDPSKIIAVLDWEMTTVGSPLMDLGCSLAYWIEKDDPPAMQAIRMMPTNSDGMMSRQQIVAYYAKQRNISIENFDYFYIFGLFRLAVIVQQIYKRFALGKTSNPAFAAFGDIAKVLIKQANAQLPR